MSRHVPDEVPPIWRPHRLTLPVTVMVFLSPWFAGMLFGAATRPLLLPTGPMTVPATVTVDDVAFAPPSPAPAPLREAAPVPPEAAEVRSLTTVRGAAAVQADVEVVGAPPDPLTPGSPPAATLPDHDAIGLAALGRIGFDWQARLPGWTIDFRPANGGLRGLTMPDDQRIEIYVHTSDVWTIAAVTAHEIGHAVDLALNNTVSRRAWKTERGMAADTPWWPTPGHDDFATGSGDFAECFATLQVGSDSRSDAGLCSDADLDALASLIGA